MTELSRMLKSELESDKIIGCEEIDIDYLIHDVLIIKAESLKSDKIFNYADYLENQLLKIKKGEAVLNISGGKKL